MHRDALLGPPLKPNVAVYDRDELLVDESGPARAARLALKNGQHVRDDAKRVLEAEMSPWGLPYLVYG